MHPADFEAAHARLPMREPRPNEEIAFRLLAKRYAGAMYLEVPGAILVRYPRSGGEGLDSHVALAGKNALARDAALAEKNAKARAEAAVGWTPQYAEATCPGFVPRPVGCEICASAGARPRHYQGFMVDMCDPCGEAVL